MAVLGNPSWCLERSYHKVKEMVKDTSPSANLSECPVTVTVCGVIILGVKINSVLSRVASRLHRQESIGDGHGDVTLGFAA